MIVTVLRPYGGQEGKRIRVGTRFWVTKPGTPGKPPEGVTIISYDRFQALSQKGMVTKDETDIKTTGAKVVQPRKAPAVTARTAKAKTDRQKSEQKHKGQNGGRTGKGAGQSSSQAAPVPGPSTGLLGRRQKRGQRGSDGLQSTTPTASAPGQTANTQQTGDGGGTTDPASKTGEKQTPPPFV